jgi:HrpA-like RNA helicase
VTKIARPKENILDVVQELYRKRQRNDQILCFVNSVSEVHQCCRLLAELSRETIKAHPLIQSQSASVQQLNIQNGSVFFSTTVAETSLTFPSLKYVIDTGMVNMPMYNPDLKRTVLEQVQAADSTIKQRIGRLGRTTSGEYYYLYDFRVENKLYPTPHICVSDLTNIEFSLRRSPIKRGLHYLQEFLPNPPSQKAIDATVDDLRTLGEWSMKT